MTMATQITVDRSSLSLSDLVIGTLPGDTWWLPEDGLGRPGRRWVRAYATAPDWHGAVATAARLEMASLPLIVKVIGSSTSQVETRLDTLQKAFSQFFYNLELTVDGVSETWAAEPADIEYGSYDSGMVSGLIRNAVLTVPVFPIPIS